MSGLKINFSKSEVIMVSQDGGKSLEFSNLFNCVVGKWPIKYLGVPMSGSRLHVADWILIEEKFFKKLDGWKGSSLSLGGRLILINSSLSSVPIYAMSMYSLPLSNIRKNGYGAEKILLARGKAKEKIFSDQMEKDH